MSQRRGRPLSIDPKKHETRIRMSDWELKKLEICCKTTGMTKADVIRKGIDMIYDKISEQSQNGNKSNNVIWGYTDARKILEDWAKDNGISYECLKNRIKSGWSIEKALKTPEKK